MIEVYGVNVLLLMIFDLVYYVIYVLCRCIDIVEYFVGCFFVVIRINGMWYFFVCLLSLLIVFVFGWNFEDCIFEFLDEVYKINVLMYKFLFVFMGVNLDVNVEMLRNI